MLVNGLTQRRDIPFEEGQFMEFRQLSAVELDAAEAAAVAAYSRNARAMGAELMTALQQAAATSDGTPTRPAVRYDAMTLIELALVDWSYPVAVNPENVRRLDLRTRDWARDQVIALNFPEEEAVAGAVPNGLSGSIAGLTATAAAGPAPARISRPSSGASPKSSPA